MGLSTNADLSKKLGHPFPREAIKKRQGGGGRGFDYVEGHTVIHRLNDATENTWNLEIRSLDTMQIGNQTMVRAHVALTIPGLGTREHIGVQAMSAGGGEDLVKGAVTDALKKAATLFGVGLELYGPDYAETEAIPPQRPAQPRTAPSMPQTVGTPPAQMAPVMVSRGQLESIDKNAQRGGFTSQDLQLMVKAQGVESLDKLTADQGTKFIAYLQDIDKAKAFLAKLKTPPQQGELVPQGRAAAARS